MSVLQQMLVIGAAQCTRELLLVKSPACGCNAKPGPQQHRSAADLPAIPTVTGLIACNDLAEPLMKPRIEFAKVNPKVIQSQTATAAAG